ncbi:hypothetical protein TNCV_2843401 [Trichonephila clavipes]|nr:hypothetical protein TNCV_2843401 [Trichonephila clavipes]
MNLRSYVSRVLNGIVPFLDNLSRSPQTQPKCLILRKRAVHLAIKMLVLSSEGLESDSGSRKYFGMKEVRAGVAKNTSTPTPVFVGQFEFEMKLK